MAAPKVWVPNELLKSADLNGAFATVAQGYMPGGRAVTGPTTPVAAGSPFTELSGLTPLAGNDTGYWQEATKRFKVPVGMAGWHAVTAYVQLDSGGAQNDITALKIMAHGYTTHVPRIAAGLTSLTLSIVVYAGDGVEFYAMVSSGSGAAGTTGKLVGLQVARLASFGAYA